MGNRGKHEMKIISHRGNIEGPNSSTENFPDQINDCINRGYDVEIDLRIIDNIFYLGHDTPDHIVEFEWLLKNKIANLIQLYTFRLAWPFWAILIFPLVILRLMDWDYLEFPPNDLVTDTLWKRDYPEYIESHPHFFFIFIVNLLLGATGIFWIITYIWALLGCKRFDRRLCSVEIDEKGTTITLHMRYKLANSSPSPNDFEIIVYEHHGHTWWRNIIDVNVSGHTIEIIVEDPIPAGTDVSVRYWQEFYGGPIMEDMGDKLIGFWSEDKQTINNSTIIKSIFETSDHTKNNGEI